jgi:hypothetical protein
MRPGGEDAIVHVRLAKGRPTLTIMKTSSIGRVVKFGAVTLLLVLAGTYPVRSQEVSMALLQPAPLQPSPAPMVKALPSNPVPQAAEEHKFWDNENRVLFGAVAGLCSADFAVTYSNLSNGGKELNPVTRVFSGSTAGLAVNFVGETAGVVGISYFLHRTGHHKLERIAPLLNIAASTGAVAYGLSHR